MAINSKKLSLYIIVGVVAAIILIAAIFVSGVHLPSTATNTNNQNPSQNPTTYGTLTVSIKDAPVQLSKLEVTIDSIEVQGGNGSWINLPFIDGVQSVQVDLLTLQNISQDLSTTSLPTGNYTNIRLHVENATATYQNGNVVNLNVPSDKIDIIAHFQIKQNANTNVLIDMTADSVAISNSHNLKPVVKATVTTPVSPVPTVTTTPTSTPTPSPTEPPTSTGNA